MAETIEHALTISRDLLPTAAGAHVRAQTFGKQRQLTRTVELIFRKNALP
jgi:hypothetical protein